MHQSTVEPVEPTTRASTASTYAVSPSGIIYTSPGPSSSTSQLRTYASALISTTSAPKYSPNQLVSKPALALVPYRSSQFDKRVFKIIVIGDSNVGKTTLTYRFCEGKFLENSEATVGVDFRSRVVNIDGEDITLQLWDTAGQERFRQSMVRHYYKNTHAIIFVYDVTNAESFDGLKRWIQESYEHGLESSNLPKILIGNKCDGVSVVTTNVAQRFADQYDMPLFETSARLDSQCDNVESIFMTLAYKLKNNKTFNRPLGGNNQPGERREVLTGLPALTYPDKGGCCK